MVTHSYEVVPKGWDWDKDGADSNYPFLPFILEIPAEDHTPVSEARSARRAYFTAMSLLRQLEPEDWQLFDWTESFGTGAERGMDGLVKVVI